MIMKAPLWQYFIPKYGNFGGPGWSGGAMMSNYNEVDWTVQPVDSLDELFCNHDKSYQEAIKNTDSGRYNIGQRDDKWLEADKILIKTLEDLPIDPKEWENKPKNSIFYAWLYRKLAIYGFVFKVWLYKLLHSHS
jgi:hypothetical protein